MRGNPTFVERHGVTGRIGAGCLFKKGTSSALFALQTASFAGSHPFSPYHDGNRLICRHNPKDELACPLYGRRPHGRR